MMTRNQPYLALDRNLLHGPSSAIGTEAIEADPRFVDPAAHDYRLAAGSPAIDAALGEPLSATDHADRSRSPRGDLGAFEWSAPPSVRQH